LRLDALGPRRTHPLHDQIEALFVVGFEMIVVDRSAQELARARSTPFELQCVSATT